MTSFTPFLVADRPASLRIIRGVDPSKFASSLGIMTHANVTPNVKSFIRNFPASGGFYADEDDEGQFVTNGSLTELGRSIRDRTTIIADSGVFTKEGSMFDDYESLFDTYTEMDADYGIILDALNDPQATVETARTAIETYEARKYDFDLIGVAQGTSFEEYRACFQQLLDLGFEHVAVGGLLNKEGNRSGAFASISNEEYLLKILYKLRESFNDEWMFALGCHHPSRQQDFKNLNLFGADYKGWIYKYKPEEGPKPNKFDWRFHQVRSYLRKNIYTDSFAEGDKRLLILSCSKRKSMESGRLPAIDCYDGVYYRTLDKWIREQKSATDSLDVLILSAEHGLIPTHYRINSYDREMTDERAQELRPFVDVDLKNYLQYRSYEEVLLVAGASYRKAIMEPLTDRLPNKSKLYIAKGRLLEKCSDLKSWLNGELSLDRRLDITDAKKSLLPQIGYNIKSSMDDEDGFVVKISSAPSKIPIDLPVEQGELVVFSSAGVAEDWVEVIQENTSMTVILQRPGTGDDSGEIDRYLVIRNFNS